VATVQNIVDLVRSELGDTSKSFVMQFVADGTTNRFKLHYAPVDADSLYVRVGNNDVSTTSSVEESTGVLVTYDIPVDGEELTISGNYYRYFTTSEITQFVNNAVLQHTANRSDSLGRIETIDNLPQVEVYPVAVLATSLALYTLATDASFDIDINAPDGVGIPRGQRYRQLMEMVQSRKEQYRELCNLLGIGLYKIEVLQLRRVSKMTNQFVPVYEPQEIDDYSYPVRVLLPKATLGNSQPEHPYDGPDLVAYQNVAFSYSFPYTGSITDKTIWGSIRWQKTINQDYMLFEIDVTTDANDPTLHTITLSLTQDQTSRLSQRMYYDIKFKFNSDSHVEYFQAGKITTVPQVIV
jgi:hypothetical protein